MSSPVVPMIRANSSAIPQAEELGAFHTCWYPVALSAEVAPEQVMGVNFLGGKVIVYRTAAGVAHVKSAYCRHLGADLSGGKVLGDRIRCPYHFWAYGEDGACADVPAGDIPPPKARLFSYPTRESIGIIWAFNGETPTYDPPHFNRPESELQLDAFRNPVTMHAALPFMFINAFDLQHFKVVHHMDITVDEQAMRRDGDVLHYDAHTAAPEFGKVVQNRTLWGVGAVTIHSLRGGRSFYLLHSLCPVSDNLTVGFLVNAVAREAKDDDAPPVEQVMSEAREFSLRLVNEDSYIFNNMRFRVDCLTKSDQLLAYGLRYIASFPPSNPGLTLIS
jgi:nitrite reductase/ring-hydroxylating ferredoxin subunit